MKKYKLFYLLIPFLILVFILAIEIISLILNIKQIKTFAKKLAIDIVKNQPQNFDNNFSDWQKQTMKLTNKINKFAFIKKILPKKYYKQINQAKCLLDTIAELNNYLPKILGKDKLKTYFILLQNNLELRPSGGFMGSYAKIKFKNGAMEKLTINDIYVPDGQLIGHVDPPWPIQTAFKQGWWKLRDSNWKPDFPESAKQIQWFFSKGNEEQSDGIIAINFLVVKDLLKIIGPLKILDYNYNINADNFYQITQNEVENNFFPGSTQKKDFLGAITKYLILKLEKTKENQLIQLIKVLKDNLNEKQILIAFNDFQLNQFFSQLNWNGEIKRKYKDSKDIFADYIYLVDTNLGANKANCCVQRQVVQEINFNKNGFITCI